jgi:hypothetical protein
MWKFLTIGVLAGIILLTGLALAAMLAMPGHSFSGALPALDDRQQQAAERLRRDVAQLAGTIGERSRRTPLVLAAAADWIEARFRELGFPVREQVFHEYGLALRNLEIRVPGDDDRAGVFVVGAHYDTVPGSPGADDNASGVAVLLELARRARDWHPAVPLLLVAFANEEAAGGSEAGSSHFARALVVDRGERVRGMWSFEMLGYYADAAGSQAYPPGVKYFFGDRADFIGFVGNLGSRSLVRRSVGLFREHARLPSEGIAATELLRDIARSDHASFWHHQVPALMVSDTANFRYRHYHRGTDTPDRLDYRRMALLVDGLEATLKELLAD